MKLFVATIALVTLSQAFAGLDRARSPYMEIWEAWKEKHGVKYDSVAEEVHRLRIFEENAVKIMRHNLEESLGLHTFKTGLTKFAAMTNEEFRATYLTPLERNTERRAPREIEVSSLPDSVDWRNSGIVTPVKDQGQCGSCWSFAATGSLEGQFALSNGTLLSFSEQQQVDCNNYCYGCNGGWAEKAFYYWERYDGAELESDYQYTARDGYCKSSYYQQITHVSTYYTTTSGSEYSLEKAVASVGPIAVAIDASHWSFQVYTSGVYYEPSCSTTNLDHAVLAVGYGTSSGQDYWLVKNSWGSSWGQDGYIWMSRNRNNNCGIATDGSYPQV